MKNKGALPLNVKTPWPTKDAMEQVYAMKLWGDNQSAFYSGEGSHLPELVAPYIDYLGDFLRAFDPPLVVCDLGCGDFNIGSQLVNDTQRYKAIDIVPNLIAYNKAHFTHEKLDFRCLDIATDAIPSGDCAILRQVLQHLSNAEIQRIVKKLAQFTYVIVTEHIPAGAFTPNKDQISGQGIRLKNDSGVDLLAAPFNLKVKEVQQVLSQEATNYGGRIVTTLYRR